MKRSFKSVISYEDDMESIHETYFLFNMENKTLLGLGARRWSSTQIFFRRGRTWHCTSAFPLDRTPGLNWLSQFFGIMVFWILLGKLLMILIVSVTVANQKVGCTQQFSVLDNMSLLQYRGRLKEKLSTDSCACHTVNALALRRIASNFWTLALKNLRWMSLIFCSLEIVL